LRFKKAVKEVKEEAVNEVKCFGASFEKKFYKARAKKEHE
jgi:hypothetical protein